MIAGGIVSNVSRLPGPFADVWEWQMKGTCRTVDASVFFWSDQTARPMRRRREAAAKAVCARCPVRAQCATYALSTREPHGIWGGFTETERRRLLALGWEDLADRGRGGVDVVRLTARLKDAARRHAQPAGEGETVTVTRR
jgi:WhiB family redox-sensing transcriptional regulator